MVIVTRAMRIGINEYHQLDVTGPMTVDDAKRYIAAMVAKGKGSFGQYSWRDAEYSQPAGLATPDNVTAFLDSIDLRR